MKLLYIFIFLLTSSIFVHGQSVIVDEGSGVGPLKLGQSFEEVVDILGFEGNLKTYDDYLDEELFSEDPDIALECAIGFDYYIKYQHLLTIPVSYVFFKDNKITQIKVSSFPEYYFAIAKETKTGKGVNFWSDRLSVVEAYGEPDLEVKYDSFILDSYFYFKEGITVNLRADNYRTAHIYYSPDQDLIDSFSNRF